MIYKAGAGPKPIPHKELTVKKLVEAIKYALSPAAKEAAKSLAQKIRDEVSKSFWIVSYYRCQFCLLIWNDLGRRSKRSRKFLQASPVVEHEV